MKCLTFLSLLLLAAGAKKAEVRNFRLSFEGEGGPYYVAFDASHKSDAAEIRWGSNSSSRNCTRFHYDLEAGYQYHCSVDWPAGDTIYYIAGLADRNVWGPPFAVSTLPDNAAEYRVWVCGDVGLDHAADTIAAWGKMSKNVAFALHPGDISYANDHPQQFEHFYSKWFLAMAPGIATTPYLTAPGNHESWSRNPAELATLNFTSYKKKFRMPMYSMSENMFYSFDYGAVHYVAFNSETDSPGHPHDLVAKSYPQLEWLEKDLASVDRAKTPFIVVFAHRPYYISYGQSKVQIAEQAVFEPLFHKYGVDLGLFGHVHHYERMYPTFDGTRTPTAMTTVVAGGGGSIEGVSKYETKHPAPYFARGYDAGTSYGILTVVNGTQLRWNLYASKTMELQDELVLNVNPR